MNCTALETGGRTQLVAEIEKIHGCHGLHDIDLVNQHFQDGSAAGQAMDDGLQFGGIVVERRLAKDADDRIRFIQELMKP